MAGLIIDGGIVDLNSDPTNPSLLPITRTSSVASQYNDVAFDTNVYIAVQEYNNTKGCVYTSDLALTAVTKAFEDTITSQFNSIGIYQNAIYVCGKAQVNQTINNIVVPSYVSYILKINGTTITRVYDPIYTSESASPGYYYSSELYHVMITPTGNIYACGYILEKQIQGTGSRHKRGYVIKTNSQMSSPTVYYIDQNIGSEFKYVSVMNRALNMFGTNGTNPYKATLNANEIVNVLGKWTSAYSYVSDGYSVVIHLFGAPLQTKTRTIPDAVLNFYDGFRGVGSSSTGNTFVVFQSTSTSNADNPIQYIFDTGSLLKSRFNYNVSNVYGFLVGYKTNGNQNFGTIVKYTPPSTLDSVERTGESVSNVSDPRIVSDPDPINNTVTNISVQTSFTPVVIAGQNFGVVANPLQTTFTPIKPVVAQGGTGVYTYTITSSPANSPSLLIPNASTGVVQISSIPNVTTETTYTYGVRVTSGSEILDTTFQIKVLAAKAPYETIIRLTGADYTGLSPAQAAEVVNSMAQQIIAANPGTVIQYINLSNGSVSGTVGTIAPIDPNTLITVPLGGGIVLTNVGELVAPPAAEVAPTNVVCLLETCNLMLTDGSYKNVKSIKTGDILRSSLNGKDLRVLHCGHTVISDLSPVPASNHPMCIPEGFFAEGSPSRDVFISGHHRLFFTLNDTTVGIQVFKLLPDANTLTMDKALEVVGSSVLKYYHLEVEGGKNAVFCDGLPVETLDVGEWSHSHVENQ